MNTDKDTLNKIKNFQNKEMDLGELLSRRNLSEFELDILMGKGWRW